MIFSFKSKFFRYVVNVKVFFSATTEHIWGRTLRDHVACLSPFVLFRTIVRFSLVLSHQRSLRRPLPVVLHVATRRNRLEINFAFCVGGAHRRTHGGSWSLHLRVSPSLIFITRSSILFINFNTGSKRRQLKFFAPN